MGKNKILAIKGDKERGSEVIALLEMLGGVNKEHCQGIELGAYYYIDIRGCITYEDCFIEDELEIFTLEEFLEKYPFKVGDKVERKIDWVSCFINDMRWNSDRMCVEYHLCSLYGNDSYGWHIAECFNKIEENEVNNMNTKEETPVRDRDDILFDSIIWHLRNSVNNGKQYLSGGDCETYFRELVKKVKENDMETKVEATGFIQVGKTVAVIFNDANYDDEVELQLGDYEIEVRDGKTYAVKKKPIYPETYSECFYTLYGHKNDAFNLSGVTDEEYDLFGNLIKLKRCRDAYWKIAGEEMGLGKLWEPDWNNTEIGKHCIFWDLGDIDCDELHRRRCLLSFPTEEMRDAFYENFKDLIEQCKELL